MKTSITLSRLRKRKSVSKLSEKISKVFHKLFKSRVYAEVTIYMKDGKTDEILHTYPIKRLYEGDSLYIGPLKFNVEDIKWT